MTNRKNLNLDTKSSVEEHIRNLPDIEGIKISTNDEEVLIDTTYELYDSPEKVWLIKQDEYKKIIQNPLDKVLANNVKIYCLKNNKSAFAYHPFLGILFAYGHVNEESDLFNHLVNLNDASTRVLAKKGNEYKLLGKYLGLQALYDASEKNCIIFRTVFQRYDAMKEPSFKSISLDDSFIKSIEETNPNEWLTYLKTNNIKKHDQQHETHSYFKELAY